VAAGIFLAEVPPRQKHPNNKTVPALARMALGEREIATRERVAQLVDASPSRGVRRAGRVSSRRGVIVHELERNLCSRLLHNCFVLAQGICPTTCWITDSCGHLLQTQEGG
jgi:hypothetical protein